MNNGLRVPYILDCSGGQPRYNSLTPNIAKLCTVTAVDGLAIRSSPECDATESIWKVQVDTNMVAYSLMLNTVSGYIKARSPLT